MDAKVAFADEDDSVDVRMAVVLAPVHAFTVALFSDIREAVAKLPVFRLVKCLEVASAPCCSGIDV